MAPKLAARVIWHTFTEVAKTLTRRAACYHVYIRKVIGFLDRALSDALGYVFPQRTAGVSVPFKGQCSPKASAFEAQSHTAAACEEFQYRRTVTRRWYMQPIMPVMFSVFCRAKWVKAVFTL
jgi:hypothetical protein